MVFPTLYIEATWKLNIGGTILRVNYEILNILYHMEAWSKIVAATQKEIIAALAGEKVIFTEKTIYLHLRELIRLGYSR